MSETRKTIVFGAAAAVLVLLALVSAPHRITPNAFLDQGEAFFPDFTDPNAARTLEVIDFDDETGSAVPFKVTFKDGRWSIPSHYDYPADGKDRLARTAAGVISLRKDDFRSDNVSDHEACGVIDPLDETATGLKGRGQRVTIKGENDVVLADIIIGNAIEGRDKFHFVRVPGQKRVYACRVDMELSTKFKDWIESDLLQVARDDIESVTLRDYRINERTGAVDERDVLTLNKDVSGWKANRMKPDEEVVMTRMNELLGALDDLKIEGVRPKPAGLSATLSQSSDSLRITTSDLLSLQSSGYFFSRDGQLLSNEGELEARTRQGVVYTLRFGEVAHGTGQSNDEAGGSAENRYLFITTRFDQSMFPEPKQPANTDFLSKADSLWTEADFQNKAANDARQNWQRQVDTGRSLSRDLNQRFANWYYVISSASFDKLRATRADIVQKKKK